MTESGGSDSRPDGFFRSRVIYRLAAEIIGRVPFDVGRAFAYTAAQEAIKDEEYNFGRR